MNELNIIALKIVELTFQKVLKSFDGECRLEAAFLLS